MATGSRAQIIPREFFRNRSTHEETIALEPALIRTVQDGGKVMEELSVDDVVRLRQDIPELALARGDRGVVRSRWFAPLTRYEVEFSCPNQCSNTRALLRLEQMEVEAHAVLLAAGK